SAAEERLDDVTMRREQEEAALAVPPVFVVDQRARTDAAERWSAFQEHALAVVSDPAVGPRERAEKLKVLGVTLDGAAAEALAGPFVVPSVSYDRAETEWRRSNAKSAVPDMVGMVKKDELIVDANERVSRETVLKLRSLRNLEAARRTQTEHLYPPLARMLLMLLFISAFATYLRMELPWVFADSGMLAMFTVLTLLVLACVVAIVPMAGLSEFAVPLALAPLV